MIFTLYTRWSCTVRLEASTSLDYKVSNITDMTHKFPFQQSIPFFNIHDTVVSRDNFKMIMVTVI